MSSLLCDRCKGRRYDPYASYGDKDATCLACGGCGSVVPATRLAAVERERDAAKAENERLRKFAFGDRPEWEKANCTLKHEARDLRARVEELEAENARLREALEHIAKFSRRWEGETARFALSGSREEPRPDTGKEDRS